MLKSSSRETKTIVLRAYAMTLHREHNSVRGFKNNMADVESGNYSIPEGSPGLVVETRDVPVNELNKNKFRGWPAPDRMFLVRKKDYYTQERVADEFGENSELFKKMKNEEAPFVVRFTAQNEHQQDQFRYMAWYDMAYVVTGKDRTYTRTLGHANRQKKKKQSFAVVMQPDLS